ncbi:Replication factor C large subunit like [Actinidia chinensis var. chinensis]|uniref:Replication factor C large subunit like n=1 Tax=Actinidia chinensis var. chinensis TaxID=1590841 RepID=A0A2R6QMV8_ACTCC|nr:Replication factor C large subunit like [Actinidia chinensis var. chinensis]
MISLSLTPLSASSLSFKPPLVSNLKPQYIHRRDKNPNRRRFRNATCRAELSQDAPFAVAIGACILNSLVFPIASGPDDEQGDSVIDSTDTRFAVMVIISFIPYFNWLSWVFAWLDTGKQRYVVYSLVYLAPYLRSNLSLSPEDSWLPIASIVLCIMHIQLEASIKNGDFQGFQLFSETTKNLSSITRKKEPHLKDHERISEEERAKDSVNLPSADERARDEIRGWGVPQKPLLDPEQMNEDEDANDGRKH